MLGIYPELVAWVVRAQRAKSYLEIGVFKGGTFNLVKGLVERAIGVDVANRIGDINEFYQMTSDRFFEEFHDKVDVVFIDGDHRWEQLKKDFENSLLLLNEGGTLLVHDTDPAEAERFAPTSCADSYKLVEYIHKNHLELDIITFPVNVMGISVVRRKMDRRVLSLLE